MEDIPHASIIGSLMYVQTCMRLDIAHTISMLVKFHSNPTIIYWKLSKKSYEILAMRQIFNANISR